MFLECVSRSKRAVRVPPEFDPTKRVTLKGDRTVLVACEFGVQIVDKIEASAYDPLVTRSLTINRHQAEVPMCNWGFFAIIMRLVRLVRLRGDVRTCVCALCLLVAGTIAATGAAQTAPPNSAPAPFCRAATPIVTGNQATC